MNEFLEWSRYAFRNLYAEEPLPANSSREPLASNGDMLKMACRHRVAGLWVAAGLAPTLKQYAYGQSHFTARCTAEAERLYSRLLSVMPSIRLLKGPALALQAWPQQGLRHYDDLDFRCDREYFDALSAEMTALGYTPEAPDSNHQANLWHFGWGVAFVNAEGFRVECNHRLFPPHFPAPARFVGPVDTLWTDLKIDQREIVTFNPAAHLLYCSMHAIWHGWERLSWVVDIAGLMIRHSDSLAEARKLAGKSGFPRRALDAACCVADGLFGPLPGWDGNSITGTSNSADAVSLLLQTGNRIHGTRKLQRQLCTKAEWLRSTCNRLMTPGDPEFQRWSLDAGRRHRYWLLRPLRLMGRLK